MNFLTEVTKGLDKNPEGRRVKQAVWKAKENRTKVSAAVWGDVTPENNREFCTFLSETEPERRDGTQGQTAQCHSLGCRPGPTEISLPSLLLNWVFMAAVARRSSMKHWPGCSPLASPRLFSFSPW